MADAKHSWLDARPPLARWSAWSPSRSVSGAVTRWPAGGDRVHRARGLGGHRRRSAPAMDGMEPDLVTAAEAAAGNVPGVRHVHARGCWTGRTLRLELEGWSTARSASPKPTVSAGLWPRRRSRGARGPQPDLDRPQSRRVIYAIECITRSAASARGFVTAPMRRGTAVIRPASRAVGRADPPADRR